MYSHEIYFALIMVEFSMHYLKSHLFAFRHAEEVYVVFFVQSSVLNLLRLRTGPQSTNQMACMQPERQSTGQKNP